MGVNQNLLRNTLINYFPSSRKRNLELGDYFAARCTMVQGDHDPRWKVDFTADNSSQVVLNSSFSDGLYATQFNLYQNELTVYVNDAHEGLYTCQSSFSGLEQQFLLTASRCPAYTHTYMYI